MTIDNIIFSLIGAVFYLCVKYVVLSAYRVYKHHNCGMNLYEYYDINPIIKKRKWLTPDVAKRNLKRYDVVNMVYPVKKSILKPNSYK